MRDLLVLLWLLVQLGLSHGGSYCSFYTNSWPYTQYCEYGCCGEECCISHSFLNIATIIGIVVGSVMGGILIISFIVCIICVCIKKTVKPGRVIAPAGGTDQSTVFTTTSAYPSQVYSNPVYYSYPQPPAYGQPTFASPAYGMAPSALTNQTTGSTSQAAEGNQHDNRLPALQQVFYHHQSTQQQQ